MIKFTLDYLNLIHLCKVTTNASKKKIVVFWDGKIETETFADQADFDAAVADIEGAGLFLIGDTWYNKDRLSIAIPNGAMCAYHFIGNVLISHEYADVSEVDAAIAEIEPQFIEINGKWYQGKQLHVVKTDDAALTIDYDYLGMDDFVVQYADQAAYDAAIDKIKSIGEGGGEPSTKKVATPRFSTSGNVPKGTQVTITCSTDGATIHYTDDGTTPTASSPVYSAAITINNDITLKAIAVKSGMDNSNVATASFVVVLPKVATPTITPNGGTVAAGSTVALACSTDGAAIYYTTDGTTPTSASSEYTGPITVPDSDFTLKAIGIKADYTDSTVASASFVVERDKVAAPTFSPAASAVTIGTTVSIACATAGAEIHYTTDGSNPTTSSPVYSTPVEITTATTIKAIGVKEGMDNSNVASAAYTIAKVATPTFAPAAGAVDSGTTVAIGCTTTGATIHYTTDGTTPTSASPTYSTPVEITTATTIKAIAVKSDMADSAVGTASYTINPPAQYAFAGVYNNPTEPEEPEDFRPTNSDITAEWLNNLVNVNKFVATGKTYGAVGDEKTFNGIDDYNGGRVVWAYPASFGDITSYVQNGSVQAITNSFTKLTNTVDGVLYNVYVLSDWVASASLNYAFI